MKLEELKKERESIEDSDDVSAKKSLSQLIYNIEKYVRKLEKEGSGLGKTFNISDNDLEVLKELKTLLALNFQGSDSERERILALVKTLRSRGVLPYNMYNEIIKKIK